LKRELGIGGGIQSSRGDLSSRCADLPLVRHRDKFNNESVIKHGGGKSKSAERHS